ncbi:hypothetical protein BWK58_15435, partial [Flavobacterium columnare]
DYTTNEILNFINTTTEAERNFKKQENWNIPEILEHVYLTDQIIFSIISKPSSTISTQTEIVGNDKIREGLMDKRKEQKILAPEFLLPKGEFKEMTILTEVFINEREAFKIALKKGEVLVDNRVHKHPKIGDMTIVDWLNFMIHHTQRHIEQMKDNLSDFRAK